ncbi:MAG: MBOAT family protein [Cyanothece sp. SIO1E1]|nr:MBOAT family protein [Cyanothece sp. SIO1E1]
MDILNLILAFLAVLVPICWLVPSKWQVWTIVVGTLAFLLWQSPISVAILVFTTVSSYGIFQTGLNRAWATIMILLQSVGLFVLYKANWAPDVLQDGNRLIPLGLSYYSFRQIHYAIEQYKEKVPMHSFGEYVCYMFFLPTILVGPINRFPTFMRHLRRRRWDEQMFTDGLERILYGYAKIVILGNFLVSRKIAEAIGDIDQQYIWLKTYLESINFLLNTYFQFAGFSDVAIGLALICGFRVMENFNYPLSAPNINEFWNRWHISLSSWCKDYVYIPVASITRQPIWGIIFTMLVIGLWHELSMKYIIWGLFHGVGIAIWHLYKNSEIAKRLTERLPYYEFWSKVLTFHFVVLSFVIVMEPDWMSVWERYKILLFFN